ncbi:MAG: 8-oxoguanine deaminase [Rhodobacteraceae bacterium]|nr:8-oxoguanine deaminase [Paracoccaceae bacterium]
MNKPLWIKNPLSILAEGADGGVLVANGKVIELVAAGGVPQAAHDLDVFDASAHVVLPGLINTHHHFYQTLTRAFRPALNKALFPWLCALYPVWAKLTPEMVHLSSKLALAELLLSGCTCAADHHYLFNDAIGDAIDIQVEAAGELGMRAVLTRGSMSLSVEDGGLPPKQVVQGADVILQDSARLISAHHQAGEGAMIQIALAPCSPFSVSEELMKQTAHLARENGVRLHTHLAETEDETNFCLEKFGARPLDYLERLDWIGPEVWLAHGIHFDDSEIARLGAAGMAIAHCPSSNMYLSSGICRTLELEAAGAAVGIGVDGSASNDGSNMIQEVRQALLLQKLKYGAEEVDHQRAFNWATKGSADCLGRPDLGRVELGAEADLALFKLDEPRFSGADDPLASLIICGAVNADRVMVKGHWRVIDGVIDGLDTDKLIKDHSAAARSLREAAAEATTGVNALRF